MCTEVGSTDETVVREGGWILRARRWVAQAIRGKARETVVGWERRGRPVVGEGGSWVHGDGRQRQWYVKRGWTLCARRWVAAAKRGAADGGRLEGSRSSFVCVGRGRGRTLCGSGEARRGRRWCSEEALVVQESGDAFDGAAWGWCSTAGVRCRLVGIIS
jgi:hypothetical protein